MKILVYRDENCENKTQLPSVACFEADMEKDGY